MKKLFFLAFLLCSRVLWAQHTVFAEAEKKFEDGILNEKRYYSNFSQEYFVNSYTAYHEAALMYLHLVDSCNKSEKIYASYHAMKCLYAEAEVFSAMESPKKIYELYIFTFNRLIPDTAFASYKQHPKLKISKDDYDSLWTSTLKILYDASVKSHKELYIIKCGGLLLKKTPRTDTQHIDILKQLVQTTAEIGDAENLLYFYELWNNKTVKPYGPTEESIVKIINKGISDHPDSFSEEQLAQLEKLKKKLSP